MSVANTSDDFMNRSSSPSILTGSQRSEGPPPDSPTLQAYAIGRRAHRHNRADVVIAFGGVGEEDVADPLLGGVSFTATLSCMAKI